MFFSVFSNAEDHRDVVTSRLVYKPPAVPSGAAQGAHDPAGTRGDIQAVTVTQAALAGSGSCRPGRGPSAP